MSEKIKKVVYFDEITATNILIKKNNGAKASTKKTKTKISSEVKTNFKIPFLTRVKFLFTGQFDYTLEKTIENQVLSDFSNLKLEDGVEIKKNIELKKMPNSISAFKHMSMFTKMMDERMNGVNVTDMENIMKKVSGYYTYLGKDGIYRFNEEAFQANYKAFDLMVTDVDVHCIKVSEKKISDFNYMQLFEEYYIDHRANEEKKYIFNDEINSEINSEDEQEKTYNVYDVILAEVNDE